MSVVSSEATSVLAVGIERYDWGESLNLVGAADHATQFGQWAASEGVPTGRIRLARSWVTAPPDVALVGATRVGTTRDELESAFYELMAEGGDLLLLYWCGHGVTEEGTRRVLLTSNAVENAKRNLPVDEIQRLLTSKTGVGFAQVVMVIDACANFLEDLNAERSLPRLGFGELTAREVPLFLYLSTDLGQIAEIDPQRRQAAFSTEVLRWLTDHQGGGLPPDLAGLRHDVDKVFTQRAKAGTLRQRPVSVVVRTMEGSEEDVTYASKTGADHLQHSQVRRLTDVVLASGLLSGSYEAPEVTTVLGVDGALESRVMRAFREGRGEALIEVLSRRVAVDSLEHQAFLIVSATWLRELRTAPLLAAFPRVTREQAMQGLFRALPPGTGCRARDLAGAVESAAALLPENPGGIDALHRMAVILETLTGTRVPDAWFELDAQPLTQLRAAATEWVSMAPAQLVIDLRSGGSPATLPMLPSMVTGYLRRLVGGEYRWDRYDKECMQNATGKPTLADVQQAVQEMIERVYEQGETKFTVGFVVPRTLQDLLPETWPLQQDFAPSRPLGVEHPTVLHSGERLAARAKTQAEWRKRVTAVQSVVAAAPPTVGWIQQEQQLQPQGVREAVERATETVIGFQFVPGSAPGDLAADAIIGAVMAGAPYIVWSQSAPEDWDTLCGEVRELFEQGPFADVAERLHDLRKRNQAALASGLRLLWDDPDLLVPVLPLRGAATLDTSGTHGNG